MAQKFIYLSNEFGSLASHTLGEAASRLSELQKTNINVPKSVLVPTNTLKIIAQANNLQAHCYKLIQNTSFASIISKNTTSEQIKKLITKTRVPKELGSELLKVYHQFFSDEFVKVQSSNTVNTKTLQHENIHSDTNMITSVLELWAEIVSTQISSMQTKKHSIHEVLFASPILIVEQIEPKISGKAITFDINTGSKQRITVQSSWGVFSPTTDFDTFLIDIRTKNTTHKKIVNKSKQYRRVLGKLRIDEVQKNSQSKSTLTAKQISQLTDAVSKIKRKYLSQLEIYWAYHHDKLVIESISEVELTYNAYSSKQKEPERKRLFVTLPFNKSTDAVPKAAKGLAVLNSGQLLAISGIHPVQTAKSKQKDHLITAVSRTLSKFSSKQKLPILYRANNYTSFELSKLQAGSVYESKEANPALGFRGGIRYISHQSAFETELLILKKTIQKTSQELGFILPFIRSASELQQVLSLIQKSGLMNQKNFSVWLEISTPANTLDLASYPVEKLGGVVFNPQTIHALLNGIDKSNHDIYSRYPINTHIIKELLSTTINTLNDKTKTMSQFKKPQVFVDLTDFNKSLLQQVYDLDFSGFIVNESVTELAKKCMIEEEQLNVV